MVKCVVAAMHAARHTHYHFQGSSHKFAKRRVIEGFGSIASRDRILSRFLSLKRYCSKSVLQKKCKLLTVIKKCAKGQTLVHYSLTCKNRFNPFDSVPAATLHFKIFVTSEKENFAKYLRRMSNAAFDHRTFLQQRSLEGGAGAACQLSSRQNAE